MVKKSYDYTLSRFHLIPERNGQTDRQADKRRDGRRDFAILIPRVSMLTRDKKVLCTVALCYNYWK